MGEGEGPPEPLIDRVAGLGGSLALPRSETEMRAVLQRVRSASVAVDGAEISSIGRGVAILLGVAEGDTSKDVNWLAEKIANLRIFEDSDGKMNLSVVDIRGEALVVSQFTLLADCRKGRRPGFDKAAAPSEAEARYDEFVAALGACGVPVKTGRFQARMLFQIANDGPVTILLDTPEHGEALGNRQ